MSQDADDEPEYVASVPIGVGSNPRDLLACRTCGIIKAAVQFQEEGCDNCDPGMPINDDEVLHQCTHNFSGMIAVMNPEKSWCARWTRKKNYRPGCYAIKLEDEPVDE